MMMMMMMRSMDECLWWAEVTSMVSPDGKFPEL